ncbi:hypothetical protein ACJIZ3_009567 [Penstemon smallii]|uniref:Uncharacterized protein n=1 Tax=Penstemon smallii TaxID=265156 RepID=A0ABD3TCX6_9LAMI
MASSTQKPHHHNLPTPYATTAAPPPTPSTSTDTRPTPTLDALSHLLHRLPPTLSLSLPTRRSSTPPLISLTDPTPPLLSAATQLGYFHLTHHHPIPGPSTESAAVSLFNLPQDQKQLIFPNNWPFGYDDDDVSAGNESFCLDPNELSGLDSGSDSGCLYEFGREMERIGLKVVEELGRAVGFENPARDEMCSQLWISDTDGMDRPGRVYPYVVGLHCQLRGCGKYSLWADSGWVNVSGRVDSVLVTLGDIAQVWSNGKFKKVRGRPVPMSLEDDNKLSSRYITMSLLITLPLESTVSPLLPGPAINNGIDEQENDEESHDISTNLMITGEERQFRSFSFEDYAWRVYHEHLLLKDPLIRYRV